MEAIAAHWAGLRVCGVSLVTNAGAGLSATPLTHEEVLAAASEAGPRLARVIGRFADLARTADAARPGDGRPTAGPAARGIRGGQA